jgi:Fe-Mn family superoxide dismutase
MECVVMAFELPPLPYPKNALEPHISARTLEFHHDHHHRAYVEKLNKLIAGTPFEKKSLEEIILATGKAQKKPETEIFNNAAQVWNHTFLWNSMSPDGGGKPGPALGRQIDEAFGGLDKFHEAFKTAATGQFGSGYAWLVISTGGLQVRNSANAHNPMVDAQTALLACDVWEHAYYLDYQDKRADFVDVFLDHLVNWAFVASQLAEAADSGPATTVRARAARR